MADIWTLHTDEDGICWAAIDVPGKPVNTLDRAVLDEFSACLDRIEADRPKGLVLHSTKPAGFMAGADIDMLDRLKEFELRELIVEGKRLLDRLEKLKCPTVAMIHGHCLGGGLEVALACDRRVARKDAMIGLPEIRLGLVPGLGGSRRLPVRIGIAKGFSLVLAGKTLPADKAGKLGLVDEVVLDRYLRDAARAALKRRPSRLRGWPAWRDRLLGLPPFRSIVAGQMRSRTRDKVEQRHYPAPFRLIEAYQTHGLGGKFVEAETEIFAEMVFDPSSKGLRRVFKLREQLKSEAKAGGDPGIRHVHVIGAGAMGGDIAAWSALNGFEASLADVELEPIGKAIADAHRLFAKETPKSRGDLRPPRNLLIPDPKGLGARRADLVIEAVPEKLDLKKKIFGGLSPQLPPGAIVATNTSSLTLQAMGEGLDDPSRLVGIHFFNPVSKMPLVEIVSGDRTDADGARRAAAFAEAIGKLPVPCRDAPGFIVNRALTPYLLEASRMIEEGTDPALVDALAEHFGMAQGPAEVADGVGLDIALDVGRSLQAAFPAMTGEIPRGIVQRVERGELGRKTGQGFYKYGKDGKPAKVEVDPDKLDGETRDRMTDRMILPMLNACMACLREGVAANEDRVDAALVFGAGFAPFRGGPIRYARQRGAVQIVAALETLRDEYQDKRFEPDPGWQDLIV